MGRHIWRALRDDRSRAAIEVAERFADGAATKAELAAAEAGARAVMVKVRKYNRPRNRYECFGSAVSVWAAGRAVRGWTVPAAGGADGEGEPVGGPATDAPIWEDAAEAMNREGHSWHAELGWQCAATRCIFGNPFRPITIGAACRTKKLAKIAQAIYDERAFDRLPILADALQDAGCEDADILGHCRGDGPHVRGCWVVDGVLGKG
ncbi:hypothetical protein [Limnoglobus roseus]|nr:hypothetical protein [Limnoglobus roseus]